MENLKTPAARGLTAADLAESNYFAIWIFLVILTALELIVAYAPIPKAAMIGLLTGLACANALLAAMYFMHLRFDPVAIGLIAVAPVLLAAFTIFTVLPEFATRYYPRDGRGDAAWMVSALDHAVSGSNPNIESSAARP